MTYPNPYAPPRDDTPPISPRGPSGGFIPDGRSVPAGNGSRWISDGWVLFKRNPGVWIALGVLQMVIGFALGLIPYAGRFLGGATYPILAAGMMLGCRELVEGRPFDVGTLFAGFRSHADRLLAAGALYAMASLGAVAVAAVIGGPLLQTMLFGGGKPPRVTPEDLGPMMMGLGAYFVILIPISMAFYFAPALMVLNDLGPLAALRASFLGSIKNIPAFFIYGMTVVLLSLGAVITCGIGIFVLVPTLVAATYCTYRDVFYEPTIPEIE
jgi:hypothetical protein